MKKILLTVEEDGAQVLKLEFMTERTMNEVWVAIQTLSGIQQRKPPEASVGKKYQSLYEHFGNLKGSEQTFSFDALAALIGTALPPSASEHRAWWANDETHSQAKAWLLAGWRTKDVDLTNQTVVFQRAP